MMDFRRLLQEDWLEAFLKFSCYGEADPRVMYWVGVSTIAGALRRKVWINQAYYQYVPNFYILIVADPSVVKKSTSIDIGFNLLQQVDDIYFGPTSASWQAFIADLEKARTVHDIPGHGPFEMSCITQPVSEFGTFFDPENRELADNLTDLWDNKPRYKKSAKTTESNNIVNPYVNILGATTPAWFAANFKPGFVGSGLGSRLVIIQGKMTDKDVAYPDRVIPPHHDQMAAELTQKLRHIAELAGPMTIQEEAYEWGEAWYKKERDKLRNCGIGSQEGNLISRKQGMLHKLAMVISAARNEFPYVTKQHLQEADAQLKSLEADAGQVQGLIGQDKITSGARRIVDIVTRLKEVERRKLYRKHFMHSMKSEEYDSAIRSAVMAELIMEINAEGCTLLVARTVHD